jgi:glycosyltransferase involved in cell wall biosynthesis
MKILIITSDVGRTAPGIVFERLIQGLSSLYEVDILTAEYDPSLDLSKVGSIIVSKKYEMHYKIHKFLISIININPYDCFWTWKLIRKIKSRKSFQYEIVFSLFSMHNYAALIAGKKIALKLGCKAAFYSVDAIPSPPGGWPESIVYARKVKRLISNYLSTADAFFSSNDQMLKYQLSTFFSTKNLITDVVYSPINGKFKEFIVSKSNTNYFVYTGSIYGARNINYLLEGFKKLLELYPDSYIIFVGTSFPKSFLKNLNQILIERIKIYPFTKELDMYYACATALIDIDADLENDVFLSSKIISYLTINRIIISETSNNSPSRNIFKNIDSIIQCDHDSDQLYDAMKKAIELKSSISFDNRKSVLELFSIKNVADRLSISFAKLS